MPSNRHRISIKHGPHLVSAVLSSPGPTHSVFDVLAAAAYPRLRSARSVCMLGFAGGATLAPLRSLGCSAHVDAVDIDLSGARMFERIARVWAGDIDVHHEDAAVWMARPDRRYDIIVEDLTIPMPGDVIKPEVAITTLPELMPRRLARDGIAVVNVLPTPGWPWPLLLRAVGRHYPAVRVVELAEYENRVLIGARALPPAHAVGRGMRAALEQIGSRLAKGLRVRAL